MRVLSATIIAAFLAAAGADAGEVSFKTKPKAVREGKKVKITFGVSAPTDVAVEIVAGDGKIVRHLGGAALGAKNPPPPPFKPGLSQVIEWDGKDDRGKPVAAAGLKVRVRLGLKAGFDRFIGWSDSPPLDKSCVNGIAVTPDRKVYVMSISRDAPRSGRSENRLWVMSPEGKYLKTLYPYPATMDPAKLSGVDFLSDEKNRLQPRVYDRVCISTLPQMRAVNRQTMDVTSDGRIVFMSGWGTELYSFGPRSIMIMKSDGSIPRERLDGPTFGKGIKAGYNHLGLAPDEKSVYVCGMKVARWGKDDNVVYRVGLGVNDKPEVIFGKLGKSAAGKEGLNQPRGLAVDGKGRVYVSDFGNDRIAVLDPAGKYLGEIPVKGPGVISVHPKTGAVYAISMPVPKKVYKLVKITSFEKPKVAAELDLTRYGGVTSRKTHVGYHPIMGLDPYGAKPVVYLGAPSMWAGYRVLRITDEGATLKAEKVYIGTAGKIKGYPYPQGTDSKGNLYFRALAGSIGYDPFISSHKYNADSGKIEATKLKSICVAGKDGLFYMGKYQGKAVMRTDESGKVVPFTATGQWSEPYNDWRFYDRRNSWHALPSGDIWGLAAVAKAKPFLGSIIRLGPDGKVKQKDVVTGLQGPSSPRVDSRGNIYVADGLTLDGQPYPPEIDAFAKRLRAKGSTKRGYHSEAVEDTYGEAYGSVFKFGPQGGRIRKLVGGEGAKPDEKLLSAYPHRIKFAAKGLKRVYPRISTMSPPRYDYPYSACWCLFAIMDLDSHDRLFVPDAMQFCVRVLDANFNEILKFGAYDSATSKGGKANSPGPAIPLEFPTYVHASDGAVYVTDSASCARRIVRLTLGYTTEETCAIR